MKIKGFSSFLVLMVPLALQAKPATALPFGLLFDQSDLPAIRQKAKSSWGKPIMEKLRKECSRYVGKELDMRPGPWRRVCHQAHALAFVGLVDNNRKYLEESKRRTLAMAEVNPWLNYQMLTTGDVVKCIALSLDWGWSVYSKDEAVKVIRAMVANAIDNSLADAPVNNHPKRKDKAFGLRSLVDFLRYDYEYPFHAAVHTTNNWDVVTGNGLMMGWAVTQQAVKKMKLPIADKKLLGYDLDEKRLAYWYDIAKQRFMNFTSRCYSSRGQYNEGPGYYSYGTENGLMGLEVARRIAGEDLYSFGLRRSPEWQRELYPWAVSDGAMNFNDASLPAHPKPHIVARLAAENQSEWMNGFFRELLSVTGQASPLSLIWAGPKLGTAPVPQRSFSGFGETGDYVYRTGRDSQKDLHWVFRCGKWNGGHTHHDRNAILLNAFGERLLVDAGKGRSYRTKTHKVGHKSTEAHNCVLVDGKGQTGYNHHPTFGRVLHLLPDSCGWVTITGDAKHCYPNASVALRTVHHHPDGFLVVFDVLGSPSAKGYSRIWNTDNRDGKAKSRQREGALFFTRPGAGLAIVPLTVPRSIEVEKGWIDGKEGVSLRGIMEGGRNRMLTVLVPHKKKERVAFERQDGALQLSFKGKTHRIGMTQDRLGFTIDDWQYDGTNPYNGLPGKMLE